MITRPPQFLPYTDPKFTAAINTERAHLAPSFLLPTSTLHVPAYGPGVRRPGPLSAPTGPGGRVTATSSSEYLSLQLQNCSIAGFGAGPRLGEITVLLRYWDTRPCTVTVRNRPSRSALHVLNGCNRRFWTRLLRQGRRRAGAGKRRTRLIVAEARRLDKANNAG
eukprot:765696-Hanusia_phi.AAC.2